VTVRGNPSGPAVLARIRACRPHAVIFHEMEIYLPQLGGFTYERTCE
jgi:hypothetical protein